MKIDCTVEELKELTQIKTSSARTHDVDKCETIKDLLAQALRQDVPIHIDTKAPSLIELITQLKMK